MSTKHLRREATKALRHLGILYPASDAQRLKAFWLESARKLAAELLKAGEITADEAREEVAKLEARPQESFCPREFTWTEEQEQLYRELEALLGTPEE